MTLDEVIGGIAMRLADLEARFAAMGRHGTVAQVDAAKHLVRLKIGGSDDAPMLSDWLPYAQVAGALKLHTPPSVGQQMTIISPDGDLRTGVALPFTWSMANPSPSSAADQHVLTFGNVTMTLKDDGLTIAVGGVTVAISANGLAVTGGTVTHDAKNIGHDHVHSGVISGDADTGPPV